MLITIYERSEADYPLIGYSFTLFTAKMDAFDRSSSVTEKNLTSQLTIFLNGCAKAKKIPDRWLSSDLY
jgi:hypothetical protein